MACILVVDDDPSSLEYFSMVLANAGHAVRGAENGLAAVLEIENDSPHLIVSDMCMPQMGGHELLRFVRERWPEIPVILISIQDDVRIVVDAVRDGARNFLLKPIAPERLVDVVNQALRERPLGSHGASADASGIVGRSRVIVELRQLVAVAARSDVPVLIAGETGSGKELVARAIHRLSNLGSGPWVPHNCAACPRDLFESMLFGSRKGAFTGAGEERAGLLRGADGGVFFLDELEAMDLDHQAKLLRVLDDGDYRPVGSVSIEHVTVRFLASTDRDPEELIRQGRLREDLYYRVRGFEIHVPPLRERADDIPLLVAHFLGDAAQRFSPAALEVLGEHSWPGNVRELKNVLRSALASASDGSIEPQHLRIGGTRWGDRCEMTPTPTGRRTLREVELDAIRTTLQACGGNQSRAARILGIDRATLRRKMKSMPLA